jgi:hypothetical protein
MIYTYMELLDLSFTTFQRPNEHGIQARDEGTHETAPARLVVTCR